jgi:hypothetical protein
MRMNIRGLKISQITVFIAVGLLSPMPDHIFILDDFQTIFAQLQPGRREDLLVIAKALLEVDKNRGKLS